MSLRILILGPLFLLPALASAAPIQWPVSAGGNDHWYDFVSGNRPWTQANSDAEALTFDGVHGYLATITSAGESDFIEQHFAPIGSWLGGYQDTSAPDYSEPAGGWRWVTGEPWSYTNWATIDGFPDDFGGHQDYVRYCSPLWDDIGNNAGPGSNGVDGFFVEYTVPEPAAGALLAVTAAGLLLRGKRSGGVSVSAHRTSGSGPEN